MSERSTPSNQREKHIDLMRELKKDHEKTVAREQERIRNLENRLEQLSSLAQGQAKEVAAQAEGLVKDLKKLLNGSESKIGDKEAYFETLRLNVNEYIRKTAQAEERLATLEAHHALSEKEKTDITVKSVETVGSDRARVAEETKQKVRDAESKTASKQEMLDAAQKKKESAAQKKKDADKAVRESRKKYQAKMTEYDETKRLISNTLDAEKKQRGQAERERIQQEQELAAAKREAALTKRVYDELKNPEEGVVDVEASKRRVDEAKRDWLRLKSEMSAAESDVSATQTEAEEAQTDVEEKKQRVELLEQTTKNINIAARSRDLEVENEALEEITEELNRVKNVRIRPGDAEAQAKREEKLQDLNDRLTEQNLKTKKAKRLYDDDKLKSDKLAAAQREYQIALNTKRQADKKSRQAELVKQNKAIELESTNQAYEEAKKSHEKAVANKGNIRSVKAKSEEANSQLEQLKLAVEASVQKVKEIEAQIKDTEKKKVAAAENIEDLADDVESLEKALVAAEVAAKKADEELKTVAVEEGKAQAELVAEKTALEKVKRENESVSFGAESSAKRLAKLKEDQQEKNVRYSELENNRVKAEEEVQRLEAKSKRTINIPGTELFVMIGDLRLQEIISRIITVGEDTPAQAKELIKNIFSSQVDRGRLRMILERFNYTTEEFIQAWKDKFHETAFEMISGVVEQERRNWLNNNITWKDTIGTNIWESTKLAAKNVLPAAAVIAGSAAVVGVGAAALVGSGSAVVVAGAGAAGGLMRGLKKAYGWFSGQAEKRQQALAEARKKAEAGKTSDMQKALLEQFKDPNELKRMANRMSQKLRDASLVASVRDITPRLQDANSQVLADIAWKKIKLNFEQSIVEGKSAESAEAEKSEQITRLETMLIELNSKKEITKLIEKALAADPKIFELFRKIPGLREMLPVSAKTTEEKQKAAVILESALAGALIGGVASSVPGVRVAMSALAGAVAGAKVGQYRDEVERKKAIETEYVGRIKKAEAVVYKYEAGETRPFIDIDRAADLDEVRTQARDLRTALTLGIFDNKEQLPFKLRAQEALLQLDIIYMKYYLNGGGNDNADASLRDQWGRPKLEYRKQSLEKLMSALSADIVGLSAEQEKVKQNLLSKPNSLRVWRYAAAGALAGFAGAEIAQLVKEYSSSHFKVETARHNSLNQEKPLEVRGFNSSASAAEAAPTKGSEAVGLTSLSNGLTSIGELKNDNSVEIILGRKGAGKTVEAALTRVALAGMSERVGGELDSADAAQATNVAANLKQLLGAGRGSAHDVVIRHHGEAHTIVKAEDTRGVIEYDKKSHTLKILDQEKFKSKILDPLVERATKGGGGKSAIGNHSGAAEAARHINWSKAAHDIDEQELKVAKFGATNSSGGRVGGSHLEMGSSPLSGDNEVRITDAYYNLAHGIGTESSPADLSIPPNYEDVTTLGTQDRLRAPGGLFNPFPEGAKLSEVTRLSDGSYARNEQAGAIQQDLDALAAGAARSKQAGEMIRALNLPPAELSQRINLLDVRFSHRFDNLDVSRISRAVLGDGQKSLQYAVREIQQEMDNVMAGRATSLLKEQVELVRDYVRRPNDFKIAERLFASVKGVQGRANELGFASLFEGPQLNENRPYFAAEGSSVARVHYESFKGKSNQEIAFDVGPRYHFATSGTELRIVDAQGRPATFRETGLCVFDAKQVDKVAHAVEYIKGLKLSEKPVEAPVEVAPVTPSEVVPEAVVAPKQTKPEVPAAPTELSLTKERPYLVNGNSSLRMYDPDTKGTINYTFDGAPFKFALKPDGTLVIDNTQNGNTVSFKPNESDSARAFFKAILSGGKTAS